MASTSKLEFWSGAEYWITGGTKMRRSEFLSRLSHRLNAENTSAIAENEVVTQAVDRLRGAGSGLVRCSDTGPSQGGRTPSPRAGGQVACTNAAGLGRADDGNIAPLVRLLRRRGRRNNLPSRPIGGHPSAGRAQPTVAPCLQHRPFPARRRTPGIEERVHHGHTPAPAFAGQSI